MVAAVPGGLGRWRFAHALVREVLYEGLPAPAGCACTGGSGRRWRRSMWPTRGRTWPSWPTTSWPPPRAARRWPPGRCGWPPPPAAVPWRCWPGRRRPGCSSGPWPPWSWPSDPTRSSAASCCSPWGRPGWRPATWPPPAPPTSRPPKLARRIGLPEALARAALGLGLEFTSGIVDPAEVGLLEEALVALGEADSRLRARVLARLARALLFTPQTQRRLRSARRPSSWPDAWVTRRPWPRCCSTAIWPSGDPIRPRWLKSGWRWPPR